MFRKVTELDIIYIKENYGKLKAQSISNNLGLTIHQVYAAAKKHKLGRKQNIEVSMDTTMDQIILSGILGDGRLKRNGLHNFYYSECHALGEKEYLSWKHSKLGALTKHSNIYPKNANNKHGDAVEFTTLTTPTLIKYASLSRKDVINQLDELGILLFMLDDGWTNKYISGYSVKISRGMFTLDEMNYFAEKCFEILGVKPTIIGIKRQCFNFKAFEGIIFQNIIAKYNMQDLDVVIKKFNK